MSGNGKGRWQRRSEGEWGSLLARFEASGLSVEAFCQRESISTANFYRWRSRLKGGGAQAKSISRYNAPVFIDAGPLGASPPRRSRVDLKLDLGEGWVLQLVRS